MRRILCYGDSNTWGYDAAADDRFPEEVRWTGVLQQLLGGGPGEEPPRLLAGGAPSFAAPPPGDALALRYAACRAKRKRKAPFRIASGRGFPESNFPSSS